jgi:poly(3-hydroxybutyrate) depolymerase
VHQDVEVKTYTSRDLAAAATTPPDAPVAAELRAFSRIRLDGDIEICVPTDHGEPDRALWQLHVDMVKQAQAHRAELMQMLLTTAARLARGG